MKRYLSSLVVWLLFASYVLAGIEHSDAPGLTLYARIFTSITTSVAVALTEGTSGAVGNYKATDAAILSAGLSMASWPTYPAGFPYKVFSGTPSTTANDPWRGSGALHWSGSVELASAADAKQIASDSTAASNLDDAFDEAGSSGVDMALQSLTVSNTGGNAVTLLSANAAALTAQVVSGNGNGISFIGSGSGEGAFLQGGSSGNGFEVDGGATGDDFVLTGNDWPGLETLVDFLLDDGTTAYDRTTDSLQEIRDAVGPAGGGVNVTQWNGTNVATPSVAGVPEVDLTYINGSAASALSGNIDTSNVILETTVGTVTSTSVFTLAAGSTVDDAYVGQSLVVYDDSNSDYPWVGTVSDYVGSTKTVTIMEPLGFTPVSPDEVRIFVGASADYVQGMVAGGPIEHTLVPASRTLQVRSRADGSFDVAGNQRIRMKAGETMWWAVQLAGTQLATGDLVDSVSAPTLSGAQASNMTVPTYGVFGTLVKFKCVLSGSAATTDTINVVLTITPNTGETLKVTIPVTVGS